MFTKVISLREKIAKDNMDSPYIRRMLDIAMVDLLSVRLGMKKESDLSLFGSTYSGKFTESIFTDKLSYDAWVTNDIVSGGLKDDSYQFASDDYFSGSEFDWMNTDDAWNKDPWEDLFQNYFDVDADFDLENGQELIQSEGGVTSSIRREGNKISVKMDSGEDKIDIQLELKKDGVRVFKNTLGQEKIMEVSFSDFSIVLNDFLSEKGDSIKALELKMFYQVLKTLSVMMKEKVKSMSKSEAIKTTTDFVNALKPIQERLNGLSIRSNSDDVNEILEEINQFIKEEQESILSQVSFSLLPKIQKETDGLLVDASVSEIADDNIADNHVKSAKQRSLAEESAEESGNVLDFLMWKYVKMVKEAMAAEVVDTESKSEKSEHDKAI